MSTNPGDMAAEINKLNGLLYDLEVQEATLRRALKTVLQHQLGVQKDVRFEACYYCPHCGAAGVRVQDVFHEDGCWYGDARKALGV